MTLQQAVVLGFGLYWAVFSHAQTGVSPEQIQDSGADEYKALLDGYCISCHNDSLKTAGIVLSNIDVTDINANQQLWERVVTKLSLRAMPPVGMPRPPGNILYGEFLTYLRTELDSAADQSRNIAYKTAHRLNRTEYANAIRDLLHLEIDSTELLPADNVGDGFDNNADVLVFSPLLMESYVSAAARVSRLAIGPASMEPASESYTIPDTFLQQDRASADLPVGSRGGTVVQHYFPQDGEYVINVKLHRNLEGYIRGLRNEHTMDIRLDYKSMGMLKIGGEVHGRSGPIFTDKQTAEYAGELEQVGYEFTADNKLQLRFQAKAGSSSIGVTFVDQYTKSTGILMPELTLAERVAYKGGVPTVASITVTGPFNSKGPGLTASQEKIFVCRPSTSRKNAEENCANTILSGLARQAFRRPVTSNEIDELMAVYRTGQQSGQFEGGIELALQSILASPDFLIRIEADPPGLVDGEVYRVSDLDMASRLSFFLWSSVPDEELLSIAEKNQLRNPSVLKQQVQRMMADSRFSEFINNFGSQWLAVRNVDNAEPNIDIFTEFDGELKESFKQEMLLWFESMVREDQSVLELMTSDYTYVNGRLARHYGIPGLSRSSPFRRVSLANHENRKGLLGKGGVLLATSYNNRTSPVLRGKWVLENLLSMPPPPPPEDVPALEVSDSGKVLTLKEAMEKHRANPVCSSCHKLMDPIGFALENFDAIGTYRTRYVDANAEVDVSGILFDGTDLNSVDEFMDGLMKYSDRIVHTVAEKVLTYALGRQLNVYDQYVLRQIVEKSANEDHTWSALLFAIIDSTPFQYRRVYSHDDI
jgi:hypothetical protein